MALMMSESKRCVEEGGRSGNASQTVLLYRSVKFTLAGSSHHDWGNETTRDGRSMGAAREHHDIKTWQRGAGADADADAGAGDGDCLDRLATPECFHWHPPSKAWSITGRLRRTESGGRLDRSRTRCTNHKSQITITGPANQIWAIRGVVIWGPGLIRFSTCPRPNPDRGISLASLPRSDRWQLANRQVYYYYYYYFYYDLLPGPWTVPTPFSRCLQVANKQVNVPQGHPVCLPVLFLIETRCRSDAGRQVSRFPFTSSPE